MYLALCQEPGTKYRVLMNIPADANVAAEASAQ